MANVWFGSDFHFGHKRIAEFRQGPWTTELEHRNWIINECNKVVTKRDRLYVLGDAAFTMDSIQGFDRIKCFDKILIRGNHDLLNTTTYLKHFKEVYGLLKYKDMWLSHAPIHPAELRGKVNMHGHVHYASIMEETINIDLLEERVETTTELDKRYFNCCVENIMALTGRPIISLGEIRKYYEPTQIS